MAFERPFVRHQSWTDSSAWPSGLSSATSAPYGHPAMANAGGPSLRNHTVWACDYLQVHDIWFRPLFACFVIDVNKKEVVHIAVTHEPSERWTARQLRNITPVGNGPMFTMRDRGAKFGTDFDHIARGAGMRVLKTAIGAPQPSASPLDDRLS